MPHLSIPLIRYWVLIGLALAAGLTLQPLPAHAGVIIEGTRQIYPQQRREITIRVNNTDKHLPRLVKAWLSERDDNKEPEHSNVPFTLSPPIFRLDAGKSQAMRLTYTQEPLPQDRESVFWLNVLEVPPNTTATQGIDQEEDSNQLRFAFRIRTKVFFRPQHLIGTPEQAPAQLIWTLTKNGQDNVLRVHNPSAYHVTFNEIALASNSRADAKLHITKEQGMVAPGATLHLVLQENLPVVSPDAQVHYKYINDYGAFSTAQRATLKF